MAFLIGKYYAGDRSIKPEPYGNVASVQRNIFMNADRAGYPAPKIVDPFWAATSRNYIDDLPGTIYDYGSETSYQKNYLSLGATDNKKQNNYYQNTTNFSETKGTVALIANHRTTSPAYYAAGVGLKHSGIYMAGTRLHSSEGLRFVAVDPSGYSYETEDLSHLYGEWVFVIGKWDASTSDTFKVFVKILNASDVQTYGIAVGNSSLSGYEGYTSYQASGNLNYTNYYDVETDISLFGAWDGHMLSDEQCLSWIDNPYFLLARNPARTFSIPSGATPATYARPGRTLYGPFYGPFCGPI